ncbi:MAG: putative selenium-dependent hydroxylase accessory protein YqeC [Deltaproteobacteria bacterium]|jgi:probable selenium-dependent hydroxylase accessory protein YqeC|nr:putative selenium-dependent hydroxylase accessory protein YqeC [Deltaproteobacteria bacterium]
MRTVSLLAELEHIGPGIICLTGGGGKTTLLYALGEEAAEAGYRALCTTTAKMRPPGVMTRLPASFEADPAALLPPGAGAMFAARQSPPGGDPGKVYGYSAAEVDALAERAFTPWIFVEADGSAGRPVKAPARHEPVIPAGTTVVIGVIGLSCLSRAFTPERVFRPERFAEVTGLIPGAAITPDAMAALALHPNGLFKNSPDAAVRLLFCNQSDLPGALEAGEAIAEALFASNPAFVRAVYLGAARVERLKCRKLTPDRPL